MVISQMWRSHVQKYYIDFLEPCPRTCQRGNSGIQLGGIWRWEFSKRMQFLFYIFIKGYHPSKGIQLLADLLLPFWSGHSSKKPAEERNVHAWSGLIADITNLRDEPLMIFFGGGGLRQKQEKKLNCYLRGKKNSKNWSAGWPGKKLISRLARKKQLPRPPLNH